MKSKRQHSVIGSHFSSAEQIESQIQEEIHKLSKKPRASQPRKSNTSDISISYNPTTGMRLQQEKHHRIRQNRRQVDSTSISK